MPIHQEDASGSIVIIDGKDGEVAIPEEAMPQVNEQTEMVLMASYPSELESCQRDLIGWCDARIRQLRQENNDLHESLMEAQRAGLKTAGIRRQRDLAAKRAEFYGKMKTLLEEGYHIVPNFPLRVIAVRTGLKRPRRKDSWNSQDARRVRSESPPPTEGEWVGPRAEIESYGDQNHARWYPTEFDPSIDFPFTLIKPQIMERFTRAMAMKVFDEIGVLNARSADEVERGRVPAMSAKGDPIIAGRIIDPRSATSPYSGRRMVTFLIAWWLDTREL